jgi:hypothetical protein
MRSAIDRNGYTNRGHHGQRIAAAERKGNGEDGKEMRAATSGAGLTLRPWLAIVDAAATIVMRIAVLAPQVATKYPANHQPYQ